MSTKVVGSQRPKASCKSYLVVFLSVNLYPIFTFSIPKKFLNSYDRYPNQTGQEISLSLPRPSSPKC